MYWKQQTMFDPLFYLTSPESLTYSSLSCAPHFTVNLLHILHSHHEVSQGVRMVKPAITLQTPAATRAVAGTKVPKVAWQVLCAPETHILPDSVWAAGPPSPTALRPPLCSDALSGGLSQLERELVYFANNAKHQDLLKTALVVAQARVEFDNVSELTIGTQQETHPVAAALSSAVGVAVAMLVTKPLGIQPLESTFGTVQLRVGTGRLFALDVLNAILQMRSETMDKVLAQTQAPVHAMKLLYWNVWGNLVHNAVNDLVVGCLKSQTPELVHAALAPVIPRSIAHARHVLTAGGKPLASMCGFSSMLVSVSRSLLDAQLALTENHPGLIVGVWPAIWAEFVEKHLPALSRLVEDDTPCHSAPRGMPTKSFVEWASASM